MVSFFHYFSPLVSALTPLPGLWKTKRQEERTETMVLEIARWFKGTDITRRTKWSES